MVFFRRAMNSARKRGDWQAARRWADRLNDLIYKRQSARDRAVDV